MVVRVELKEFKDKEKCKEFVNDFIKDKKLRQTRISPIMEDGAINYFVYIEYED